jgi:hypothetical protein
MRMRVVDILQMLAAGMKSTEILDDFDYPESDDILAALAYAVCVSEGSAPVRRFDSDWSETASPFQTRAFRRASLFIL